MLSCGHSHRSWNRKKKASLSDALPGELSWQDGGVHRCPNQVSQSAPSRDSVQVISQMSTTRCRDWISYIPDHNGLWRPLDPNLKVLSESNMVIQKLQEEFAFLLLISNNLPRD